MHYVAFHWKAYAQYNDTRNNTQLIYVNKIHIMRHYAQFAGGLWAQWRVPGCFSFRKVEREEMKEGAYFGEGNFLFLVAKWHP